MSIENNIKNNIEVKLTCPLGSTCEKVVTDGNGTGYIERCAWYTPITGINQQGEEHKEFKCAMAWQPILTLEMAGTNRGQTEALCSFRDEVVKGTERTNELLSITNLPMGVEEVPVYSSNEVPSLFS